MGRASHAEAGAVYGELDIVTRMGSPKQVQFLPADLRERDADVHESDLKSSLG
jgi:hypothetical protein